ncbi:hypothetical protein C4K37_0628 [Pseudomonas chlororaphis subsp. piscium]|nr:hypothetical protein C4K37_0628 [Pseudomonas chlororaphis subsp. piscium]AZC41582.1 hypothetical protein C4K36_0630 [Pseudomonas chlororaphis subsp. piscium]
MPVVRRIEGRLSAKSKPASLERLFFTPKLAGMGRAAIGRSQEPPPAADKLLPRRVSHSIEIGQPRRRPAVHAVRSAAPH